MKFRGLRDLSPAYVHLIFYLYFYSTKFVYLPDQALPYHDPVLYSSDSMISMVRHVFLLRPRAYWSSYMIDIYKTTIF